MQRFNFGNGVANTLQKDKNGRIVLAGNPKVGQTTLNYDPNQQQLEPETVKQTYSSQMGDAINPQTGISQQVRTVLDQVLYDQNPEPLTLAQNDVIEQISQTPEMDQWGRTIKQGDQHYQYDSQNRLTKITSTDETGNLIPVADYRYNTFNQRIAKTTYNNQGSTTKTTYYFYDGNQLIAETVDDASQTANNLKQYIWLNDTPIAVLQQEQLYYIHTDHRNAPIAVTDNTSKLVWQADNEDFGYANINAKNSFELNLRLSNQYYDSESGLHYNTNRYYDALNQQYLTPDPLGLAVGPDLFAFALNQPHSISDPDGLAPDKVSIDDYSLEDKFAESLKWAAIGLPSEIGSLLLEMVDPVPLALATGIMVAWAASHAFGLGVAADAILLSAAYISFGAAAYTFGKGLYNFVKSTLSATCAEDLKTAGTEFSKALSVVLLELGGAAAGSRKVAGVFRSIFGKANEVGSTASNTVRNAIKVGNKTLLPCCFVAGTMVATPNGYAAIETLNVGDAIYTKAEDNTGQPYVSHVTATHERNDQPIYELKLSQQDFNNPEHVEYDVLKATAGHPFYVNNTGFVSVKDLQVGDVLSNLGDNNKITKVEKVNYLQSSGQTYNLTVEGGHTFYVGKFNTWVHNVGPCYVCVAGLCGLRGVDIETEDTYSLLIQALKTMPKTVRFKKANTASVFNDNIREVIQAMRLAKIDFNNGNSGAMRIKLQTAYGKFYENLFYQKNLDKLDIQDMGVKYGKSEMDIVTKTEVIQLKTGKVVPDDNQMRETVAFAKEKGLKAVWMYNSKLIGKQKIKSAKDKWASKGWDIEARPDNDMEGDARHIILQEIAGIKF